MLANLVSWASGTGSVTVLVDDGVSMLTSANCLWLCPRATITVLVQQTKGTCTPDPHPSIGSQHNRYNTGDTSVASSWRATITIRNQHWNNMYVIVKFCTRKDLCRASGAPVYRSFASLVQSQLRRRLVLLGSQKTQWICRHRACASVNTKAPLLGVKKEKVVLKPLLIARLKWNQTAPGEITKLNIWYWLK